MIPAGTKLSVIPNYDCNFSCSYRYYAGSHAGSEQAAVGALKGR